MTQHLPPRSRLHTAFDRVGSTLARPGLRKRLLTPVLFDGLFLGTNLITGIIVARSLGPSGRGALAAILVLIQMSSWIFSIGGARAVSFYQARYPHEAARVIGTWLTISLPLSVIAILVGELAIPALFNAQPQETIDLGRIYLLVIVPMMLGIVFNGILLGDERTVAYGVVRLVVPGIIATGYCILLLTDRMSVEAALIVNAIAVLASTTTAATLCVVRHSLARPGRSLLRDSFFYGLKAHPGLLAGFVSARLDLLIVPAFLVAASVGLYSVATNVSSIIATLTGTLALVALPAAARDENRSTRTVIRTMHATLAIGASLAIVLLVIANWALTLIYGREFEDAAGALRILLPGEVLSACAVVLISGILAANRPSLASVPAVPGAVVTVAGLLIFLPSGTIETAALVTTVAYTSIFLVALLTYRRIGNLRWIDFVRPPRP